MSDSYMEDAFSARLRAAAMDWLRLRCTDEDPVVRRGELLGFHFEGERIPLVDPNRGIRKPKYMTAALSILTTYTAPGKRPPYDDKPGSDGLLRYKYRGRDDKQADNVALRVAHERKLPLIWFYGVAPGLYLPRFPAWLIAEEKDQFQFAVALDEAQLSIPVGSQASVAQRRYAERLTRQRLHQPVFRAQVLRAYEGSCAICNLRHASLLDAAHIMRDSHPEGIPAVSNGLALCKIHHAAYDKNFLGIRPDYTVEIREDLLDEEDGPMLRHGLQEMDGIALKIPKLRQDRPSIAAIMSRYEEFKKSA
ncbi:HNH endonuclease [Streptosporangium sandarakinum]|uniref:HNH endonuclease n=1 Tax=Streptosporangium sandarakinum TaxID=1260955 RepID=UPI00379837DF